MQYRTRDNDVLDRICWRYYGSESTVVDVLAANPGLADIGPVYASGVMITLPDLPEPDSAQTIVKLWD